MTASLDLKRKTNAIILLASALGGLLSLYLWNSHLAGSSVICVTGCDAVLKSQFSQMMGVPVAAYGFAFYSLLILLAFQRSMIDHVYLDKMLGFFILVGAIYTLYLRYVEFFEIGNICMWCWGSVVLLSIILIAFLVEQYKVGFFKPRS